MENYFDIEEPEKGFSIKKLFKWIAIAIIVIIDLIIFIRCITTRDDKIVSKILKDADYIQAYNSDPESFTVVQYGMDRAWIAVEEGRLIQFNYLYHIEKAKELQFSVKYNKSLAHRGANGEDPFRFRLVDESGTVYDDYFFERKTKQEYCYIRLCFKNIELIKGSDEERKTYTLYIDKFNGTDYEEYCSYELYKGSKVSKKITKDVAPKEE